MNDGLCFFECVAELARRNYDGNPNWDAAYYAEAWKQMYGPFSLGLMGDGGMMGSNQEITDFLSQFFQMQPEITGAAFCDTILYIPNPDDGSGISTGHAVIANSGDYYYDSERGSYYAVYYDPQNDATGILYLDELKKAGGGLSAIYGY